MYQTSSQNLQEIGININTEFFTVKKLNVPLLKGINLLLQSIDSKGLKLTQNGFLPTKIVKSIVEVAATV